jgi:hypothetical protein
MTKTDVMKYPLVMASVIFFWMPLVYALIFIFPYSGPFLFFGVLVVTCTISAVGALLILFGRCREPARRFPVVLFTLDLLVILIFRVVGFLQDGSVIGSISESVWAAGLLLLAPCSLVVFNSIPADRKVRVVTIALTLVICAPAAIALILLVQGFPHAFDPALGLMALYWIAGMPVIGACYLAFAVYAKGS